MLWLILGIAIGFTWHWFLGWARARNVHISWLVWLLLVYTLVASLSGVQNFVALTEEYEAHAARMVVPVYGIQTLVGLAPALLLLWRAQRKANLSRTQRPAEAPAGTPDAPGRPASQGKSH